MVRKLVGNSLMVSNCAGIAEMVCCPRLGYLSGIG